MKGETRAVRVREEFGSDWPSTAPIKLRMLRWHKLRTTVNSLRTTLCTAGCSLLLEVANAIGPGIDPMVDLLLQNLIKLCANTKPIARANANEAVLAVLSNASYHLRIMNHVHAASQDKNAAPRKFACSWLKKIIKKHPRGVIEHAGGLDLIEKALKAGLQDRDKDVREAMRPTYWAFARRWPEKSDAYVLVNPPYVAAATDHNPA